MKPYLSLMLASAVATSLKAQPEVTPKGVHRVTSNSRTGRKLTSAKGAHDYDDSNIPPDIREWNARVEEEKAAKRAAKGNK